MLCLCGRFGVRVLVVLGLILDPLEHLLDHLRLSVPLVAPLSFVNECLTSDLTPALYSWSSAKTRERVARARYRLF